MGWVNQENLNGLIRKATEPHTDIIVDSHGRKKLQHN
jgi:hypothetical protein